MAHYSDKTGASRSSATRAQSLFSQVPTISRPRSLFDRSHGRKTTFDGGFLVPVFLDWQLPGDTINLAATFFARMGPQVAPIMDNVYMTFHLWAVPYRLVYDKWEQMNGQQENPGDSTSFILPTMTSPAGGYLNQSLHDYMGLPTLEDNVVHQALPLRAYNLIWNNWYRDQNLQDSVTVDRGEAASDPSNYTLLRRGKRHDYFTSALPFLQKGPDVNIPLGQSAPVTGDVVGVGGAPTFDVGNLVGTPLTAPGTGPEAEWNAAAGAPGNATWNNTQLELGPNAEADLSAAIGASLSSLRSAITVQHQYEIDARGGTRYTEVIYANFGVESPDQRLQRPEYLGGSDFQVVSTPIASTIAGIGTDPLGTLAAQGVTSHSGNRIVKSFTEHTIVLGVVCARAPLHYQQGLGREWSKSTRFDHFLPAFEHLSEQDIKNKEIFFDDSDGLNDDPFGFTPRYNEYRYMPSQVTGKFRSNDPQSLDFWHLAQDFDNRPVLNSEFIEEDPPLSRSLAVPSEPDFLMDCWFDYKHVRPIAVAGTPGVSRI